MQSGKVDFVHLHVHSHYSMLDGSIRMPDLCARTVELGMHTVALTDHGNMYGALDFQENAVRAGLKPIFGSELYMAPDSRHSRQPNVKPFHLLVLAANEAGYRNLCKLSSISFVEGFYRKPRIDKELLAENCEGLVLGSACLAGELAVLVRQQRFEEAVAAVGFYRELVGAENFFIEIMDHDLEEQRQVNIDLVRLARRTGTRLVATNDVHFLNREDYEASQILTAIGTQAKWSDQNRFKLNSDQFYLKSPQEMLEKFREIPEAVANSVSVAEQCALRIQTTDTAPPEEKYKIPVFETEGGLSEAEYLRRICNAGLQRRYSEVTAELQERLDYELQVIEQMGFPGYFLIVWDFIRYARENGIPVGPGRGSAAGSLVAYSLRITDVDPIRYGLLFERFLNPDRISMPDIDIDFADRDKVIEYTRRRYGEAQVSNIVTYMYMKSKAVVKDVARVLEIDFSEANRISALIPDGAKLKDAMAEVPELQEVRARGGVYERLFRNAFKLENVIRNPGIHACGIVITPRPLLEYIPLAKDTKTGSIVAQFDGPHLETVGLLKMDFLGLQNLVTIDDCIRMVRDNRSVEIDFDSMGLDDPLTYQLLQQGKSIGVFQVEGDGMQRLLCDLKPEAFEEIIALLALYRPGPLGMGMHTEFVDRKFGRKKIAYEFPELEPILRDTNGIIIYQEQVMNISRTIGGFTMGEADNLRKAMGKKKPEMIAKMREKFVKGALARNFDRQKVEALYDLMAEFAQYGFNKSHSTAYAVITYRTAYLKANYPLEYMAALLTSVKDDHAEKKLPRYIQEVRSMGIRLLPPDVNHSRINFSVDGEGIRFGLSAIKGVGEAAAEAIVDARSKVPFYHTMEEFCRNVDMRTVNRRVLEVLIKCGAFGSTGEKRSVLMAELEDTMERAGHMQADMLRGQGNFFDMLEEAAPQQQSRLDLPEWPEDELFAAEKELLSSYVSGHPLDRYRLTLQRLNPVMPESLARCGAGGWQVAGIVRHMDVRTTKAGKRWAILTLEGFQGSAELKLWEEALDKCQMVLVPGRPVLLQVVIKPDWRKQLTVNVEGATLLEEKLIQDVHIHIRPELLTDDVLFQLREELLDSRYHGPSSVFFHLRTRTGRNLVIKAHDNITVSPGRELLDFLQQQQAVSRVELR